MHRKWQTERRNHGCPGRGDSLYGTMYDGYARQERKHLFKKLTSKAWFFPPLFAMHCGFLSDHKRKFARRISSHLLGVEIVCLFRGYNFKSPHLFIKFSGSTYCQQLREKKPERPRQTHRRCSMQQSWLLPHFAVTMNLNHGVWYLYVHGSSPTDRGQGEQHNDDRL